MACLAEAAIKLGKTLCSHEIVITDDEGRRLCTARITNALISPKAEGK